MKNSDFSSKPALSFLIIQFFTLLFLFLGIFGFIREYPKLNFTALLFLPLTYASFWNYSEAVTIRGGLIFVTRFWGLFRYNPISISEIKKLQLFSRDTVPKHHNLTLTLTDNTIRQIEISNFYNAKGFVVFILKNGISELDYSHQVREFIR